MSGGAKGIREARALLHKARTAQATAPDKEAWHVDESAAFVALTRLESYGCDTAREDMLARYSAWESST